MSTRRFPTRRFPTRRFIDRFRPDVRLPDIRLPGRGDDTSRPAPILNAHFRVLIGQHEVGVARISELHLSDPGQTADGVVQTLTLTRAIDADRTFYRWRIEAAAGKDDRRRVRIHHLYQPGDETPAWTFTLLGALPVRWSGPRFDAIRPELAWEELELSYKTIGWILPKSGGDGRADEGTSR
jgi:phage tail-like protein